MSHRMKRTPAADRHAFRRTASKTKDINVKPKIMRGGIRL